MDLLEEVKKIQTERGLNDTQMSELLGYKHRTGWARIKSGVAPANEVFEMRAQRAFPDDIHVFRGLHTTPAEKPQGRAERGVKGILDKIVLKVKKYL